MRGSGRLLRGPGRVRPATRITSRSPPSSLCFGSSCLFVCEGSVGWSRIWVRGRDRGNRKRLAGALLGSARPQGVTRQWSWVKVVRRGWGRRVAAAVAAADGRRAEEDRKEAGPWMNGWERASSPLRRHSGHPVRPPPSPLFSRPNRPRPASPGWPPLRWGTKTPSGRFLGAATGPAQKPEPPMLLM
jgi:hypothetical protein